jgi:hypothetical protein
MTMRELETAELSAIEGGLGRGYGSLLELWSVIKKNGGFVGDAPPPTAGVPQLLDAHTLLRDASLV